MKWIIATLVLANSQFAHSEGLSINSAVAKIPILKYPELARFSNLQGKVKVTVTLLNGKISNLTLSDGPKVLTSAASSAVRQFEFNEMCTGSLVLDFDFILVQSSDPSKPLQHFTVNTESSTLKIEASQKVIKDSDYFK
jgi:hypothetical protein